MFDKRVLDEEGLDEGVSECVVCSLYIPQSRATNKHVNSIRTSD